MTPLNLSVTAGIYGTLHLRLTASFQSADELESLLPASDLCEEHGLIEAASLLRFCVRKTPLDTTGVQSG